MVVFEGIRKALAPQQSARRSFRLLECRPLTNFGSATIIVTMVPRIQPLKSRSPRELFERLHDALNQCLVQK